FLDTRDAVGPGCIPLHQLAEEGQHAGADDRLLALAEESKHRLELAVGDRSAGLEGGDDPLHLQVVGLRHPAIRLGGRGQLLAIDRWATALAELLGPRAQRLELFRGEALEELPGLRQPALAGRLNSLEVVLGHGGSIRVRNESSMPDRQVFATVWYRT